MPPHVSVVWTFRRKVQGCPISGSFDSAFLSGNFMHLGLFVKSVRPSSSWNNCLEDQGLILLLVLLLCFLLLNVLLALSSRIRPPQLPSPGTLAWQASSHSCSLYTSMGNDAKHQPKEAKDPSLAAFFSSASSFAFLSQNAVLLTVNLCESSTH